MSLTYQNLPLNPSILYSRMFYWTSLVLLFLFAFSAPIYLAVRLSTSPVVVNKNSLSLGVDRLFPKLSPLSTGSRSIRVAHHEGLNPKAGSDFLVVGWFQLRRLPEEGERILLLSKYDADSASRTDYAIGLVRERDSIRPMVYWRDSAGEGQWETFSDFVVTPGKWFMLAVSFREGRFLGVHGATYLIDGATPKVEVLGGYDLGDRALPESVADLVIAPPSSNKFQGSLGALAILRGKQLTEDLDRLLQRAVVDPLQSPLVKEDKRIKLWLETPSEEQLASAGSRTHARNS